MRRTTPMMRFLIDKSPADVARKKQSPLVLGQLLTPLTRYRNWGGVFAIDNGAYSGFDAEAFRSLLLRDQDRVGECLFVTCPDVVGAGRRTLEIFRERRRWIPERWPVALVAQNGLEDLDVPWEEFQCLFVGGIDPWKDSKAGTAREENPTEAKVLSQGNAEIHRAAASSVDQTKNAPTAASVVRGSYHVP